MHDHAIQEMKKLEKQLARDNRKLDALRLIIREYATDEYPGTDKMNTLIEECIKSHGGHALLQQIAEYIAEQQIILPRYKLSLLLSKNSRLEYNRKTKKWIILPNIND